MNALSSTNCNSNNTTLFPFNSIVTSHYAHLLDATAVDLTEAVNIAQQTLHASDWNPERLYEQDQLTRVDVLQ